MGDENEKVLDIFFEGQKAIFKKLDTLGEKMEAVPLHGLEILHIKTAITEIKDHCGRQHQEKEKVDEQPEKPVKLHRQIGTDLARATALFLFIVFAFTCFTNVQAYLNQQHTITVTK